MFYFLTKELSYIDVASLLIFQFLPFSLLHILSYKYLFRKQLSLLTFVCTMTASFLFSVVYAFFISQTHENILLIHGFMIVFVQTLVLSVSSSIFRKESAEFLIGILLVGSFSMAAIVCHRFFFLYLLQFDSLPIFSDIILNWYLLFFMVFLPLLKKVFIFLRKRGNLSIFITSVVYYSLSVFFIFLEIISLCRYPNHTTRLAVSAFFFERNIFEWLAPDAQVVQNTLDSDMSYSLFLPGLFVLGIGIVTFLLFRNVYTQRQLELQKQREEDLIEYVHTIESLTGKIRQRQHDFTNMLLSLGSYIYEESENEQLKSYFEKICDINQEEYSLFAEMSKFKNIHVIELKALIYSKMMKAQDYQLEFELEVHRPIQSIIIDPLDLIRILGILMDNAIESAVQCKEPLLRLAMIEEEQAVVFIVVNSTENKDALAIMFNEGASTKGENRGLGLSIIRSILIKYKKRVLFSTDKKENLIFQTFKVMKEGE